MDPSLYVILDRAVPHIADGLKPVQRRILHTMWEMDDGRFHKVANIVGATMRFHPHGDASIGAAMVGMGQRGFVIEPQGNFGKEGALIKLGLQGGLMGLEYLITRRHPSPRLYRALSIINFSGSAVIGSVAVHNYTIPR